jgi:hypothetical protein
MQVLEFVDAIACGDDVRKGKPHPDLYYAVLKKLGLTELRRAMGVGDSPTMPLPRKSLGLRAAGVLTGGFSSVTLVKAGCERILRDVRELDHLNCLRGGKIGAQRLDILGSVATRGGGPVEAAQAQLQTAHTDLDYNGYLIAARTFPRVAVQLFIVDQGRPWPKWGSERKSGRQAVFNKTPRADHASTYFDLHQWSAPERIRSGAGA